MKYEFLVFDLDGTISDPKDGVVRSLNYALQAHGFNVKDENELTSFIGPPLDFAFSSLTGSQESELIKSLVSKYRERYSEVGFSENTLYPGIAEVLQRLSADRGITLGVCTSKRVDFAEQVLGHFSIRHHFSFVDGGDVGIEKRQQLEVLLKEGRINHNSVMVGDRHVDLTAAHHNQLQSAGVLWGYGSIEELSQHKPAHLFSKPCELADLAG